MKKTLYYGFIAVRTILQLVLLLGIAWNVAMCMYASFAGNHQFELITLLWAILATLGLNLTLKPTPKYFDEDTAKPAPANP